MNGNKESNFGMDHALCSAQNFGKAWILMQNPLDFAWEEGISIGMGGMDSYSYHWIPPILIPPIWYERNGYL